MNKKQGNAIDAFVGRRLRDRRTELGITQQDLAAAASITFQQVQKYEFGRNRISASRLWMFSQVLKVPPSYFFEGIDRQTGRPDAVPEEKQIVRHADGRSDRSMLEIMRAYQSIKTPDLRDSILHLLKSTVDGTTKL